MANVSQLSYVGATLLIWNAYAEIQAQADLGR
jgi:hypothetical protein